MLISIVPGRFRWRRGQLLHWFDSNLDASIEQAIGASPTVIAIPLSPKQKGN